MLYNRPTSAEIDTKRIITIVSMRFYRLFLQIMLLLPLPAFGQNVITFKLEVVGNERAFLVFTDTQKVKLNVSSIASGKVVKISALNSTFSEQGQTARSGIVKSITQVKRGVYNDLYINLASPVSLEMVDKLQTYEVYLKSQTFTVEPLAPTTSTKTTSQKLPIRVVVGDMQDSHAGVTLVFPNFQSVSAVSTLLHSSAYAVDFLSYWLLGTNWQEGLCQNDQKLVHDLTTELIELRRQLAARNDTPNLNQTETKNGQEN